MNNTLRKKLQIIGSNIDEYFLYRFETLEHKGEDFIERAWRDNWIPYSSETILQFDPIYRLKEIYADICYKMLIEMIENTLSGEAWEGGDDKFKDETRTPWPQEPDAYDGDEW